MDGIPESYYEGSLALGATKERSIYAVMLPAAKSGILPGYLIPGLCHLSDHFLIAFHSACLETVQKKSVYELLAAKGYAVDWAKAKRLVQSVPEFQTNREKPDPVKIIQLLHKTGGIAIMAHPFLVKEHPPYQGKTMTRFQYMDMLVDAGLDGIEASYTYDKSSYAGRNSKAELEQQIRSRYQSKADPCIS